MAWQAMTASGAMRATTSSTPVAGLTGCGGGTGDDTIRLLAGGADKIDGRSDDDTLHIDASALGGYQLQLSGFDSSGARDNTVQLDSRSSYQQVHDTLAMPTQYIDYGWQNGLTEYIQINGIENVSTMIGTNVSGAYNGDDLLWVKGKAGGMYDGGTQRTYDTLWADWSGYSGAVTWINDPAGAALNIGPATVKNIERMLITTGASNDEIDNSKVGNTDDYIATGAGDDIIRLGWRPGGRPDRWRSK
jgi:hypothetical protein